MILICILSILPHSPHAVRAPCWRWVLEKQGAFGSPGYFWWPEPEESRGLCVLASSPGPAPTPISLLLVSGFHLPATFPQDL